MGTQVRRSIETASSIARRRKRSSQSGSRGFVGDRSRHCISVGRHTYHDRRFTLQRLWPTSSNDHVHAIESVSRDFGGAARVSRLAGRRWVSLCSHERRSRDTAGFDHQNSTYQCSLIHQSSGSVSRRDGFVQRDAWHLARSSSQRGRGCPT